MRNVTVSMDDEMAHWVRIEAARQDTSVSRFLARIIAERMRSNAGYEAAMKLALERRPFLESKGRYLTRDEVHGRTRLR